jgi:putative transposase
MTTPRARRDAALKAMEKHAITQARACRLVSVDPKTVRREPTPDSPEVRAKMREIAEQRRRFGYRRIGMMLEREGIVMNHKKLRRLYGEEGLSVKRRRGRKRALGTRAPMLEPSGPTVRWSLDFVSDTFGDGRKFRILAVIDDFTRESLALVADTSLSGERVARELDRIMRLYGRPQMIVSDNVLGQEAAAENGQQVSLRRLRSARIAF